MAARRNDCNAGANANLGGADAARAETQDEETHATRDADATGRLLTHAVRDTTERSLTERNCNATDRGDMNGDSGREDKYAPAQEDSVTHGTFMVRKRGTPRIMPITES